MENKNEDKPVVPCASSIEEITTSGMCNTPMGLVEVHVYTTKTKTDIIPKDYFLFETQTAGVIMAHGKHFQRTYKEGKWTAWKRIK